MHNEDSTLLKLGDPSPVSMEQQQRWFEAMTGRNSDLTFVVVRLDDNEAIGVWRLQNLDRINRVCEVGADIFPKFRRRGFGYKTYRMILEYLFLHYNIHTIYLRTAEFNSAGLALYRKVGFGETGRLTETIFRQGRYWDNILMCLTVDQYRLLYAGETPT